MMGVGEDDRLNLAPCDGQLESGRVARILRPRIKERKTFMAQEECIGASEGVGRRIWRCNPGDTGRHFDGLPGLWIEVDVEDRGGTGHCAEVHEKV